MSLAVIFNGQGAHYPGMGEDFIARYPKARQVIDQASPASGYDVFALLNDQFDRLNQTAYAQIAVSAVSLAIFKAIEDRLGPVDYMAGLSLGEYSALMASQMLAMDQGFSLLTERGRLMSDHCQRLEDKQSVSMEAVLNASPQAVSQWVDQVQDQGQTLYAANFNSSTQTVIGGSDAAIQSFKQIAKKEGIKKTIPLAVEGPFHTPFMEEVRPAFQEVLDGMTFKSSTCPVISNTDVKAHQVDQIKDTLSRHLVEPVRWQQTIDYLTNRGVDKIIQIGPGKTLVNLLKREKNVPSYYLVDAVDHVDGLEEFLGGHHD